MTVLLDSHTFLWAATDESKLPIKVKNLLQDPATVVLVSAVTPWELAIKFYLGKLPQARDITTDYYGLLVRLGYTSLDIQPHHGLLAASLESPHRDPFDRLLVAQSRLEQAPLVTADEAIRLLPGLESFW